MKTVKLFDAKNRISELCETVARSGEPCLVTRRGKPLVRVVPAIGGPEDPDGSPASVWDTVAEGQTKYGPIEEEIELPARPVVSNRPTRSINFDLLIAATALSHRLILATLNARHFDGIPGLHVEDWSL